MVIFQKNEKIRDIKCQKMFFKSRVRELSSFLRWILTCDDLFFPFRKTREAQKNCVGKPTQGGQNEPLFYYMSDHEFVVPLVVRVFGPDEIG